ncbi:hypothetical protein LEP1GSC127_2596 [Leptospira kirschneri str. 200801925]|nr:hypothetical protein LEP1GSC127_2596 [Leptospira kirschneri str. 200801925]
MREIQQPKECASKFAFLILKNLIRTLDLLHVDPGNIEFAVWKIDLCLSGHT